MSLQPCYGGPQLRTALFEPFEILRHSNRECHRKENNSLGSGRDLRVWLPERYTDPNSRMENSAGAVFSMMLTGTGFRRRVRFQGNLVGGCAGLNQATKAWFVVPAIKLGKEPKSTARRQRQRFSIDKCNVRKALLNTDLMLDLGNRPPPFLSSRRVSRVQPPKFRATATRVVRREKNSGPSKSFPIANAAVLFRTTLFHFEHRLTASNAEAARPRLCCSAFGITRGLQPLGQKRSGRFE